MQKAIKFKTYTKDHTVYDVTWQLNDYLKRNPTLSITYICYNHPNIDDAEELFILVDGV